MPHYANKQIAGATLHRTRAALREESSLHAAVVQRVAAEAMVWHVYRDESGNNLVTDGPPVSFTPKQAVVLGMAFHELATNAAKYGALSGKSGTVHVAWQCAADGTLVLDWRERGGPPVSPPKRAYWTGDARTGSPDEWLKHQARIDGSWWEDWCAWLNERCGPMVKARKPGGVRYPRLADAPGTYVHEL